ncbi:MAG: endonuclease/exonuclease/phosphatase family protein [Polyangiaceae bacterium]|nr:endonuclease/exonuclease/phosphatase family protein [Polyangiaceae bacterium]
MHEARERRRQVRRWAEAALVATGLLACRAGEPPPAASEQAPGAPSVDATARAARGAPAAAAPPRGSGGGAPAVGPVTERGASGAAEGPWSSPAACRAAVARGDRSPRAPGAARVGTWNVRWFPDGGPGSRPHEEKATDVAWLACTIAWLDVDVLAVQEFKASARAQRGTSALLDELGRLTRHQWRVRLDGCPNADGQHVGLLWREERATSLGFVELAELNPHGEACKDQLRPGLAGYFRFPGGLDLHLVSVHLKSGPERRSYDLRRRSVAALPAALRALAAGAPEIDADVLVAGDLNTMGCRKCSPAGTAEEELQVLERELAALRPELVRVAADPACTEYYGGKGGLLDHFLAARSLTELPRGRPARAAGLCGEAACRRVRGEMPASYERLSDHCPLVLELEDRDAD